jgi:hypothetical protein
VGELADAAARSDGRVLEMTIIHLPRHTGEAGRGKAALAMSAHFGS